METKSSKSDNEEYETANTYCIFLHILEGKGFDFKEEFIHYPIVLYASLNGVKFEIEGQFRESFTIFNSNFIWECQLKDIKRIKTESRPIRVECFFFQKNISNFASKQIGTIMLPLRNVPVRNNLPTMQDMIWLKLSALSTMWRESKPELRLFLTIVKKSLVDNGEIETFLNKLHFNTVEKTVHTLEKSSMLQSQEFLYVQLLENEGLIQVGNNTDEDNDIFLVELTFKQIEGLALLCDSGIVINNFVFSYNFLGSISKVEINANAKDVYSINEKISLNLKSSVKSLRIYFQQIFHIPVIITNNEDIIATNRFDFEKLLPDDMYFNVNDTWKKNGSFSLSNHFVHNRNSLVLDYFFSIQLISRKNGKKHSSICNILKQNNLIKERMGAHISKVDINKESSLKEEISKYEKCSTVEKYILNENAINGECDNEIKMVNSSDEGSETAFPLNTGSDNSITSEKYNSGIVKNDAIPYKPFMKFQQIEDTMSQIIESKEKIIMKSNETLKCIHYEVQTDLQIAEIKEMKETDTQTSKSQQLNNTSNVLDRDELTSSLVEELEQWKSEQQLKFLNEVKLKEVAYLNQLNRDWEDQRYALQVKLESKISKCEELNCKMERAYYELKDNNKVNSQIPCDVQTVETNYSSKIKDLEEKLRILQEDVHRKIQLFEIKNQKLHLKNMYLLGQNENLSKHIEEIEKHLQPLNSIASDKSETVTNHFQQIDKLEKSNNYYRSQWIKSVKELNRAQLSVLQNQQSHDINRPETKIFLKEILDETPVLLENI